MSDALTPREEEAIAHARAHFRAIAYIDRHLFEPFDVGAIARAAGYSASQFSRRFTRLQGESVMAYVRGRRLESAARRLLDPTARVIDIAIESGFDSQEAFTRAFVRAFACTPGEWRRSGSAGPPRRRWRAGAPAPMLSERIEDGAALRLFGLRQRFSYENHADMAALWERVIELRRAHGLDRRSESYGVFLQREDHGRFDYFAASRAVPGRPIASPLEVLTLPPCRYLVLRHAMSSAPLLVQMNVAQPAIDARAAASGHDARTDVAFQRYPQNFAIENRWVEHYFAIAGTPRNAA